MHKYLMGAIVGVGMGAAPGIAWSAGLAIGARAELAMDPHVQWLDSNTSYYMQIYGTLVATNETAQIVPNLAESWKILSDTEWQFNLRKGVKFHDGSPLEAQDVVASFQRARTLPNATSPYTGAIGTVKDVKAIDAHTVGITTTRPDAVLLYGLAQVQILPAKIATTATTDMFNQGKVVVGAGPYRFVSYQQGDRLVLERNPDFWGPKPKWDKVTFRFIPDDAARVAALLGGDLDLVDFVPPNFIERIKSNPRTDVATGPSDRVIYLIMDQERDTSPFVTDKSGQKLTKNPLKDRRVREALSLSVDRKTLTERVMDGAAIPAGQMTVEGFGGYNPALKAAMPFELARAKQLLTDAGYPDGFGIALHCTNDRYVNDAKVCQALGQMFARAGLKVDVQTMPRSVFFPKATDHAGERFSFLLLGWGNATSGDAGTLPSVIHTLDKPRALGTWNIGHYSNPAFDKIIDDAVATMDLKNRHALFAEAMVVAMQDYAVIPLYFQSVVVGHRKGWGYKTWASERTIADSVDRPN